MSARIRLVLLLLAVGTVALAASKEEPAKVETSPHAAALELVFKTQKARIRELEKGDWWHEVTERSWVVKRPFAPGIIDSTHLFDVSYRIDGKEVALWLVDTRKGEVQAADAGPKKAP